MAYLQRLSRPSGGYAWDDLAQAHLTPSYAVIGCYRLLGHEPPDKERLAEFIRTQHPARLRKLEQEHRVFEFQQIQSLLWLGADVTSFREIVRGWTRPPRYLPQYEQDSNPVFRFALTAFTCRALLGLPRDDLAPEFIAYLETRRRANGSFNNTPAADGSDGHVTNTWWGIEALATLGRGTEQATETIAWIRACQHRLGGFRYEPGATVGVSPNVYYTWAATRALKHLGSGPGDREACVRYLGSLANADGGCGDRPGWASNPLATYQALDAFDTLSSLGARSRPLARKPVSRPSTSVPADMGVFSIQIEAHGQGSPREAVALAQGLRIHLWGAKNARPGWIERAQAIADSQGVPVRFFTANEEYGTWVRMPGLGTYSHTSDIIAPAGAEIGPSLAKAGVVSWDDYRVRRLAPLQAAGGRLVWQFGENEELVRIYLDDSLERGGYAAISTFHFGNPDFTNSEPFLGGYRGQLPFVALQDAHGPEPWWFADMTEGFRTLFLARTPTWDGWLEALRKNWVVAARRDAVSRFATWMHGGASEVLDFVRERERDWRWWDNPPVQRPLVSLVALRPDDTLETAFPERGVTLRVRCAWKNTNHGLLEAPITELARLTVDDREVAPQIVVVKQPGKERAGGPLPRACDARVASRQAHGPRRGAGDRHGSRAGSDDRLQCVGESSGASRCRSASGSIPWIRNRFCRAAAPQRRRTWAGLQPSASASTAWMAAFALPFSAGAETATRSAPAWTPTTAVLRAPGWARTGRTVPWAWATRAIIRQHR